MMFRSSSLQEPAGAANPQVIDDSGKRHARMAPEESAKRSFTHPVRLGGVGHSDWAIKVCVQILKISKA